MTAPILSHLERLIAGATARPWRVHGEHLSDHPDDPIGIDGIESAVGDGEAIVIADSGVYPPFKPDADLIVSAVNVLPQLLAVAKAASSLPDCWDSNTAHRCGRSGEYCPACELRAALNALSEVKP